MDLRIARRIPVLMGGLVLAAACSCPAAVSGSQEVENPHWKADKCGTCHSSASPTKADLLCNGDTLELCWSCHDGKKAEREAHPVEMIPSNAMRARMSNAFPLENGKVTCLTCHRIVDACMRKKPSDEDNWAMLRGARVSKPQQLCFQCHAERDYRPFNAHDQIDNGKIKAQSCLWCHTGVPKLGVEPAKDPAAQLRTKSAEICSNCHGVPKGHPTGSHAYTAPPPEMMWYMSAHEMQSRMTMPLDQLMTYVKAAKRVCKSIPLDQNGAITCYSCHNPHEKGLLPARNPRALGAEPKHAVNKRLRTLKGKMCTSCHQK